MTPLKRWKFTALLVALLLLMVVYPLFRGDEPVFPLLYGLFLVTVFLGVVFVLFQRRASRAVALALGIPAVAGVLTHYLLPGMPPAPKHLFFHLVPAVFLAYTVVAGLRTIFAGTRVSVDGVNGALCGYLLIALAFGHLYCLTEAVRPGSFHLEPYVGALPADEEQRHALFTYFSLVTLTTVSYGDIVPRSTPARTLAWVEALIGQFYVAVVIAGLVGVVVSTAIQDRAPGPPDGPGSR